MATWSELAVSRAQDARRLDAEYYAPAFVELEAEVLASGWPVARFGDVTRDGARAVYENTEVRDEPGASGDRVRFLQATNLSSALPTLVFEGVGWVLRRDWDRYPSGRIRPGEILVEVKGRAEKVAIVPDDVPRDTLVSGSLYKCLPVIKKVEPLFLVAYLSSRYGRGLRARTLANTVIGFVSKDDLHALPVPIIARRVQRQVAATLEAALADERASRSALAAADTAILSALPDLPSLVADLASVVQFADVRAADRLDAEFYQPAKWRVLETLSRLPGGRVSDEFDVVRELFDPSRNADSASIRNFDLTDALFPVLDGEKRKVPVAHIGSTKMGLRAGDVVISRLRSYLRQIALVAPSAGAGAVGSSEFIVLRRRREHAISAETLVAYLRSPWVQRILAWSQDGSAHPRFDPKNLEAIVLPDALLDVDSDVARMVRAAIERRGRAVQGLARAVAMVEDAVREGRRDGGP